MIEVQFFLIDKVVLMLQMLIDVFVRMVILDNIVKQEDYVRYFPRLEFNNFFLFL